MVDPRLAMVESALRDRDASRARGLAGAIIDGDGVAPGDRRAAFLLRARAHEDLRDLAAAIVDLRAALAIEPRDAKAHNALGILLADTGHPDLALEAFRQATSLDPGYARAWNNLGKVLRATGHHADSLRAFSRAVATQSDYALAWANLGVAQRDSGDAAAAETSLRRALELDARQVSAMSALAGLVRRQGRIDEAAALLERAANAAPGDTGVLFHLAGVLAEKDALGPARAVYQRIRQLRPNSLRAAFGERLALPMVYGAVDEATRMRSAYQDGLAELARTVPALARERADADVLDDLRWTNFLLAYQGEDDRELQRSFAQTVAAALDETRSRWRAPMVRRPASNRRIRVGFVSSFLCEGTVGRYFRSWVTDLDRDAFDVRVYVTRSAPDPVVAALRARADEFVHVVAADALPSALAQRLVAADLDALVYPELGMDETTFALAALRLAPFQAAGWGHPVTTGHATIDAFFTSDAMEVPAAERHYVEELVRLPGIGTRYDMPRAPRDRTRASLGLPEGVPLFLCPQSLFKIHPANDALFARVLASVPAARLVVFEGRHPALTEKFRRRLAAAFSARGLQAEQRLVVLPPVGHDDYLRINALCDAMLDTLRWSGGNTSLDALASGLPIVTLPGEFMRSRQSAGMLSLLGAGELVARDEDDYVRIATQLGLDRTWRTAMRKRIGEAAPRLFDDFAPTRALAVALAQRIRGGAA